MTYICRPFHCCNRIRWVRANMSQYNTIYWFLYSMWGHSRWKHLISTFSHHVYSRSCKGMHLADWMDPHILQSVEYHRKIFQMDRILHHWIDWLEYHQLGKHHECIRLSVIFHPNVSLWPCYLFRLKIHRMCLQSAKRMSSAARYQL